MADSGGIPCPYRTIARTAYWRDSVAKILPEDLDPVLNPRFTFSRDTKIATAGSCFAQHIARYLKTVGDNYMVTESGHPSMSDSLKATYNYGTFSARFGNLYTTKQLVQLFDRAYGNFTPVEQPWGTANALIDPFRPAIQPNGFASQIEFDRDREAHFAAVRTMFETMDIFVFTLGLTEGWRSIEDKAMLPVCPGCGAGGSFDPEKYEFVNEKVSDVTANLHAIIERIKSVNSNAKVLLTVSPVPLVATYSPHHALTATTYSKSVLRAAVGEIYDIYDHVDYFPSYEIITGAFNRGAYYGDDLRSVREAGVFHVMKLLFKHYLGMELTSPAGESAPAASDPQLKPSGKAENRASSYIAKVVCEEELLE